MKIPYNQLLKASPHLFLKDVMNLRADGVHDEFIEHIEDGNRVLLLAPRGHGKSIIAQGLICHYILNNPNKRVMLISQSHTKATIFMSGIKRTIESSDIVKDVWGDVKGGNWRDNSITLSIRTENHVEPNLIAIGAGSSSCTGLHADLIILDDITDFDVARSSVQSERLEIWLKTSLLPVLQPSGKIVALGTRYAMGDVYKNLIDMKYNVKIFPAIRDGEALIPWLRPLNDEYRDGELIIGLNTMKRDMGSLLFDLQMMNDTTLLSDNNIIRGEWIKYYDVQPDVIKDIMISVDPAIGLKSENDYTAIGVWGRDTDNNIYLLESLNKRMTFNKTIISIGSLINRFNPERILVEDVAYQKAIIQELKRVYPSTVTIGIKVVTDKRARLINISSLFENGKVYLRKRETELIDQILYFPSSHDDLVDMMTHALGYYKNHDNIGVVIF